MKTSASMLTGLGYGIVLSLSFALLIWTPLFNTLYGLDLSPSILNVTSIAGFLILLISILSLGFAVAGFSGSQNIRSSLAAGTLGGIIAAIVVYLAIGALINTLILGVIPFMDALAHPERLLLMNPVEGILRPAVKDAIQYTYIGILATFAAGAGIGALEGFLYGLIRSLRKNSISPANGA